MKVDVIGPDNILLAGTSVYYWQARQYTIGRHVLASFSPEILQAAAVEGLTSIISLTVVKPSEIVRYKTWL